MQTYPTSVHLLLARGDIAIFSGDASYPAEKATVETFANRFTAAEQSLAESLGLQPANAVALAGKGVLLLKQGKTAAAIQEFLKASLLEPRYARVLVYLAIAYYQQGTPELALSTLEQAKEIDEKDPFPCFLESTIRKELFQPGASMQASRSRRWLAGRYALRRKITTRLR